jgi:hypothetical protein
VHATLSFLPDLGSEICSVGLWAEQQSSASTRHQHTTHQVDSQKRAFFSLCVLSLAGLLMLNNGVVEALGNGALPPTWMGLLMFIAVRLI